VGDVVQGGVDRHSWSLVGRRGGGRGRPQSAR
jgi:hypothetical protein